MEKDEADRRGEVRPLHVFMIESGVAITFGSLLYRPFRSSWFGSVRFGSARFSFLSSRHFVCFFVLF